MRREPSKPNGLVTMPTVSAPSSRAIRAIDRRGAGAGAAALARGDEHHVRALEQRLDAVVVLHRRGVAELGVRAGAQPARDVGPDLERHVRGRRVQRLRVGVQRDELDAGDLGLDHAVDGVHAAAADADHAQLGLAGRLGAGRGPLVLGRRRAGRLAAGPSCSRAGPTRRRGAGAPAASACAARPARSGAASGSARLGRRLRGRRLLTPPPSSGRAPPAVLPACSPAYRLPFESTSFASWR